MYVLTLQKFREDKSSHTDFTQTFLFYTKKYQVLFYKIPEHFIVEAEKNHFNVISRNILFFT